MTRLLLLPLLLLGACGGGDAQPADRADYAGTWSIEYVREGCGGGEDIARPSISLDDSTGGLGWGAGTGGMLIDVTGDFSDTPVVLFAEFTNGVTYELEIVAATEETLADARVRWSGEVDGVECAMADFVTATDVNHLPE